MPASLRALQVDALQDQGEPGRRHLHGRRLPMAGHLFVFYLPPEIVAASRDPTTMRFSGRLRPRNA